MDKAITIKVDPKNLITLQDDAKKLVVKPEAEDALLKLMEIRDNIDEAIDMVKDEIAQQGNKIMPGFSGVESEKLRVLYRAYGSKYSFVKGIKCPEEFVKTSERSSVDSKAVDEYLREHGELPEGVQVADRSKSLSISVIE